MLTPLSGLAHLYLTECEALGMRPKTVATYRIAIRDFLTAAPEMASDLDRAACFTWLTAMRRRGLREGGIASYQRMVWTWLKWLHRNGYTETDLSLVPRVHPKEEDIRRPTASPEAIADMMKTLTGYREHKYRNRAIVAVFASTGIRRAELSAVDFDDVDMEAGTVYVRHGKGGKQRLIGMGAEARACLWEYFLKERGMQPGPLFLARGEVRLSSGAIADMLEDLRRLSNTDVTSHQFRRHAAVRMLEADAPIDVVMGQLGHEGPQMSLTYGKAGRERRNIQTFHRIEEGIRPMRRRNAG